MKEVSLSLMCGSLSEISFRKFVALYCDGDRSCLYKSETRPRHPDEDTEDEVMESLVTEYADAIGGSADRAAKLNNLKRREIERLNIIILTCAMQIYGTSEFTDEVKKALKGIRVRVIGNRDADMKTIEARLNESIRKYKEAGESVSDNGGKKTDKEMFYAMLTNITIYFKTLVSDETSMLQFCQYVKAMEESQKRQRKSVSSKKVNKRYK